MIGREILVGNKYVVGVDGEVGKEYALSIDSRSISSRDAFVALDGAHFRGVQFVENCLKSGVELVVVKKDEESETTIKEMTSQGYSFTVVYAKDTELYFQEVARLYLEEWKEEAGGIVVGITGSNGKTTVKEMLRHILETLEPGKVWCTHKNFNNHIGVPLTILGLKPKHKFVIVEMGTNHPGEIGHLCEISPPNAGFITNVGDSHLEFFHSRSGVFKEKRTLYDAIKKCNGLFVINQDDEYLEKLKGYKSSLSYGKSGQDVKITFCKNAFELDFEGKTVMFENASIKGEFNYFNMGMCVSLVMALLPEKREKIVEAVRSFVPTDSNRSNWLKINGRDIFLDAYNANPSSMMAALEFFIGEVGGDEDSLFILGDMNELGARGAEFHQKIGAFLAGHSIREVVFVGHHAFEYNKGFGGGASCYESLASLEKDWPDYLSKHKRFFIKGSRSLQLESLIDIKE